MRNSKITKATSSILILLVCMMSLAASAQSEPQNATNEKPDLSTDIPQNEKCILNQYKLSVQGASGICGPESGMAIASLTGSGTSLKSTSPLKYTWLAINGTKPTFIAENKTESLSDTVYNLTQGRYMVIVKDGLGCQLQESLIIEQDVNVDTSKWMCDIMISANSDVLMAFPPEEKYYEWSKGEIVVQKGSESRLKIEEPGHYKVKIISNDGCVSYCDIEVPPVNTNPCENSDLRSQAYGVLAKCGDLTSWAIAKVYGGEGPFIYEWSKYSSLNEDKMEVIKEIKSMHRKDTLMDLPNGYYKVIITDANGCITEAKAQVKIPERPEPCEILTSENRDFLYIREVYKARYQWYINGEKVKGAQSSSIGINDAGTYKVEVYHKNGCITSCEQEVKVMENPPVVEGDCKYEVISKSSFESGWDKWRDGGSDAARTYFRYLEGKHALRIRDNSHGRSSVYSPTMELKGSFGLKVDFDFMAIGMEKSEDFFLEYSVDGGKSFSLLDKWVRVSQGTNSFYNGKKYEISNEYRLDDLSDEVILRFRCDASSNGDKIYLDNIAIAVCTALDNIDEDETQDDAPDIDLDETEVDYNIDNCFDEVISKQDFEKGMGIWHDGGSDMMRFISRFSQSGYVARLRDNSGSRSSMYTDEVILNGLKYIRLGFQFNTDSFEDKERFVFEYSMDGGESFEELEYWMRNGEKNDFKNNNSYKVESFYELSSKAEKVVFRFRCDASSNGDKVYIDNIVISACGERKEYDGDKDIGKSKSQIVKNDEQKDTEIPTISNPEITIKTYPNPTIDVINIAWQKSNDQTKTIEIFNANGVLIYTSISDMYSDEIKVDMSRYPAGMYFVRLKNEKSISAMHRIIKN